MIERLGGSPASEVEMNTIKFGRFAIKTLIGLLFVLFVREGFAQTADQAWLKYRPTGRPLDVPTNVRGLGKSLVEETAVAELRRGLVSLSGGSPLATGPNIILLATVDELRSSQPG